MSSMESRSAAAAVPPTLEIWARNFATDRRWEGLGDKSTTKEITGKSYKGTSLDPVYVVMRLTREFGPIGEGWGLEVEDERFIDGEPYFNDKGVLIAREQLHLIRCRMWWRRPGGERNSFICCGGTQAFYRTSRGKWVADEDVLKKSITDALTKGATYLGIGADIHAGMWDSSKYIEGLDEAEKERRAFSLAMEKVAVMEESLANCEDATALRVYLDQPRLKEWIGRQKRNHPKIHERVLELIEAARQRVGATDEPEPEPGDKGGSSAPSDGGAAPGDPGLASIYCYQSSKDGLLDWGNLERWQQEWRLRISAVERANSTARARFDTLDRMMSLNREIMRHLHEQDDQHGDAVASISRRVAQAQTALRALDADSTDAVNPEGRRRV